MNKKRAMSPAVLTFIIVFLAIVIIGIVLVSVKYISFEDGKISLGKSHGLDLKDAYINGESVDVIVGRGIIEEELTGIRFTFYKGDENISVERYLALEEGEERTFRFNPDEIPGITTYEKVSVAPIHQSGTGEEVIGKVDDTKKIASAPSGGGGGGSGGGTDGGGTITPTGPICGNSVCESGEDCSTCSVDCGVCAGNETNETNGNETLLSSVILSSSSGNNLISDDLIATPQNISGYNTLIYDWRVDGSSIAVLNMPFDTEVSTTTVGAVKDYSTYSNDGTLGGGTAANAPVWTSSGISGGAYSFDDIDDSIDLGDVLNYVVLPFSISVWVNLEADTSNDPIFSSDDGAGNYYGFWMFALPDNRIEISYGDGTGSGSPDRRSGATIESISNSTWTFVTAVVEGPNNMRIYINDAAATLSYSGSGGDMVHNVYPAKIGYRTRYGPFVMNGQIDELKIYDHALSAEQITAMYNNGIPRHNIMVSEETSGGDVWSVEVTPNNPTGDGTSVLSNSLTIGETSPSSSCDITLSTTDDVVSIVSASPEGTIFCFNPGTYRMLTISPKNDMAFMGGDGVIINGARLLTSFTQEGAYWVASGQTQGGLVYGVCWPSYPRCNRPEDLFFDDTPLHHVANLADVNESDEWYFDYDADKIYFFDDPVGHKVETSVTRNTFLPTADNVTIRDFIIEKYANPAQEGAIQAGSHTVDTLTDDWIIENNEVRFNHGVGIRLGHGAQVVDNNIHHNGQLGIGGLGDDVLIENNEIAYNNNLGHKSGWEAGGTKFVRTHNLIVRGNDVHNNNGPALWTDISNIFTLYEDNHVYDNLGGMFHEISYDAVIRNNVVERNGVLGWWGGGAGITVAASPNVEIYNNIVNDNANGIYGVQQDRGSGTYGPYEIVNLSVHNNIITMLTGDTGIVQDVGDLSYFASRNNSFENNTYFLGNATKYFNWMNGLRTEQEWVAYGNDDTGTIVRI
jgi:hypothetical protein